MMRDGIPSHTPLLFTPAPMPLMFFFNGAPGLRKQGIKGGGRPCNRGAVEVSSLVCGVGET